jgi:hypothetical protein
MTEPPRDFPSAPLHIGRALFNHGATCGTSRVELLRTDEDGEGWFFKFVDDEDCDEAEVYWELAECFTQPSPLNV